MDPEIEKVYGNRVRLRVCGLCWDNQGSLLLVRHRMHQNKAFWSPPGGGVDFGRSAQNALQREFREETGLRIEVGELRFTCEFIQDPLHAIELFFDVTITGGTLIKGTDPEMQPDMQIIEEVRFMSMAEIDMLSPYERHGLFNLAKSTSDINRLSGYIKI